MSSIVMTLLVVAGRPPGVGGGQKIDELTGLLHLPIVQYGIL